MHATDNTTNLALPRLPSALGACLMVWFCWALTARLALYDDEDCTAWLAALVLASTLLLLTAGRDGNGWDIA